MTWSNYDDVLNQLRGLGLIVDGIDTGKMRRCKVEGDREKRGWYMLHELRLDDGETVLVGSFGVWQGNNNNIQKVELTKRKLTDDQKAALKKRMAEDRKRVEADRQREADRAARRAKQVWDKLSPTGTCQYLEAKSVQAHGLRFSDSGCAYIPMLDANGAVHGLQILLPKGHPRIAKTARNKDFWPAGLVKKGHWFQLGAVRDIVLIAEGYATAASIFEATGHPVAVAFDAGNLLPVAEAIKKRHRAAKVLICADDDFKSEGNPGMTAASTAALAVKGEIIAPRFSIDREVGKKGLTDYNDLHLGEGLHTVRSQIEARLDDLKWVIDAKPRAESIEQGGGGKNRRAAVSVLSLDEAVDRFIPIDDGSGELLFDWWTNKIVKNKQMVVLLPAGVRADFVKNHPIWIERGAYYLDQVGFDPSGMDKDVRLNTWKGWPLTPRKGACDLLLELIAYLCSLEKNSNEIYNWLLCWMAYPLQNPGSKMSSAVIMHGPQGTGKSMVFQTYAKLFGDYATVLNQRGLEDKFNADWVDAKLFLLAEEVVARAEMWHIKNELKELVTGEWVRVNGKFAGAYPQRNHINLAFLSNEGQPLPLENGDRRHCVVWTPPELGQEFYDQVIEQLDNGGVEAFYEHLLNVDLTGFHPKKRPPDTQAKRNLIDLSRPSDERFLLEWIAGDVVLDDSKGPLPFCMCGTTDLYNAYERWCRQQGEKKPRVLPQFIGSLSRRHGWSNQHRDRFDANLTSKKRQRMIEPSEADFKAHIQASDADHRQKPDENLTKYATRCFFQFREALGVQP